MAENGNGQQNGVPLTGTTFDQELYGGIDRYAGFDTSIGLGAEEDLDERERTLARSATFCCCVARTQHHPPVHGVNEVSLCVQQNAILNIRGSQAFSGRAA